MNWLKGIRFDEKALRDGTYPFLVGTCLGLVAGCTAGIIVLRKEQRKYEKKLEAEIIWARAHYLARANSASKRDYADEWAASSVGDPGLGEGSSEDSGSGHSPGENAYTEAIDRLRRSPRASYVPEGVVHEDPRDQDPLEGYSDEELDELDEVVESDSGDPDERTSRIDPDPEIESEPQTPFIITYEQFVMERETYRKITMQWFDGDQTLVDENDVPVPERQELVGSAFIGEFRRPRPEEDQNVVHVRNNRISADFEIVWDGRSYGETIMAGSGGPPG